MTDLVDPALREDGVVGTDSYGQHLMLRLGRIERRTQLDSPEVIGRLLKDLVGRIGMRVLDGPLVSTEDGDQSHYGHSGVVVLVESHCALHSYPKRGEAFLDVFSCKHFDVAKVFAVLKEFLGDYDVMECTVLERGLHWGKSASEELRRWKLVR